jgi:NAD(P)-dependent dehydrogenase (short-subunit alcohol dehydrogenase family)
MNSQVVLITGGLTGIGRATALAFAKEGAQVVVSGRRDEEGQKLVSEIGKAGAEAEFIRADVRREEDVRNLIDKIVERFGRLDVAVNAAGTEGVPGPITEQTAESYAATFDSNVLGTLLSMKHELRVMLSQKSGSIVNISSTFGHTGAPGASVYSASKHAVEGLTKSAALEAAGTGVRVNGVKGRFDIVFATAGIGEFAPFGAVTEEHFDKLFNINVRGKLFTVQKALPLRKDGGSIILNGSVASVKGTAAFGAYAASRLRAEDAPEAFAVLTEDQYPQYRGHQSRRNARRRKR